MPEFVEETTKDPTKVLNTTNQNVSVSTTEDTVSTIPVIPQLSVALGLLVFVFAITYIGATNSITKSKRVVDTSEQEVRTFVTKLEETAVTAPAFTEISLKAKSAIVWDVKEQRVLFNKNADDQMPLASITKLMTALIAYELLSPEERVTITQNALKIEGDSGFVDGETFTMQNLADMTLIESSNDGATALSAQAGNAIQENTNPENTFVHAMNVKAEELGLTKTHFKNSTGLDLSTTEAGAIGSARDIALLMDYIVTHSADAVALTNLDIRKIDNVSGQYHVVKNTNEVVENIDGLIASKTGYTDLSGGNLVVAVDAGLNHPIIVTVLGSSQEGRFSDTLTLIAEARTALLN